MVTLSRPARSGSAVHDLRSAYRALRAAPGFTLVVLAVMTIAMGATTAVFSVVDAVVLRGLPFDRAERLVSVDTLAAGSIVNRPFAAPDFLALREQQDVFESVASIARGGSVALRRDNSNDPEILTAQRVSAEFFQVLHVVPALGLPFTVANETDGLDRVAVISYGFWQRRFEGAPDVVGKLLSADAGSIEIIGVMPAGFMYPVDEVQATELWIPYVIPQRERTARVASNLRFIARLKDDVTIERAQARVQQILTASAAAEAGKTSESPIRLRGLHESLTGFARSWMLMLLAAVVCVLLIACANIANLLLVRATVRSYELGVRAALGATRWNLARMLLAESLVLSIGGTALGLLAAWWGVEAIRSFLPVYLPRVADIGVDGRVLTASALAALVTGIGFGVAPAFFGSSAAGRFATERSRTNTPSVGRQWLRTTFLVAEVALAVVLLVGTALFLTSFSNLMRIDVGVDYQNVLLLEVHPRRPAAAAAPGLANVLARVEAIPGVRTSAVATSNVPFSLRFTSSMLGLPGRQLPAGAPKNIGVTGVSAGFFSALGVPLRAGRYFTAEDGQGADPMVILNESAARVLFPGESAIGKRVNAGFGDSQTVVGVVGDIRVRGPERSIELQSYSPIARHQLSEGTLILKLTADLAAILPQVKSAIWSEYPDLAIPAPHMLKENFGVLIAERRFSMILLVALGALGVVIAAIGIYGVMSFVVAQRVREIGIRMALGALASTILFSVLRRASVQVATGLLVGFGLAWFTATSVEAFLFKVEPHDVRLYLAVAGVLVMAAFTAALIPALRASRVDPLVALRSE